MPPSMILTNTLNGYFYNPLWISNCPTRRFHSIHFEENRPSLKTNKVTNETFVYSITSPFKHIVVKIKQYKQYIKS